MKLEIRDINEAHKQMSNIAVSISSIENSITSYKKVLNTVTEAWDTDFSDSVSTKEEIENKILKMEKIVAVAKEFVKTGNRLIAEAIRLSENKVS